MSTVDTCDLTSDTLDSFVHKYLESGHVFGCDSKFYGLECNCWKLEARKKIKRAYDRGLVASRFPLILG